MLQRSILLYVMHKSPIILLHSLMPMIQYSFQHTISQPGPGKVRGNFFCVYHVGDLDRKKKALKVMEVCPPFRLKHLKPQWIGRI